MCFPDWASDIVDIKPANMEELTEVITASSFHPVKCNEFVYSSSKGSIRLCDMREKALCDSHAKCESLSTSQLIARCYCAIVVNTLYRIPYSG